MNNTPNINLSTYTSDPNDKFNLMVTFNGNMNKIDTAVGNQNDQIDVIESTASTAVTTANTAVTTATEALSTANSKTSVNDNVASATTTYSSNKINELLSGAGGNFPDYTNKTKVAETSTTTNNKLTLEYTASEDCYLYTEAYFTPLEPYFETIFILGDPSNFMHSIQFENHRYDAFNSPIFKVKGGTTIRAIIYQVNENATLSNRLQIYKIPITN